VLEASPYRGAHPAPALAALPGAVETITLADGRILARYRVKAGDVAKVVAAARATAGARDVKVARVAAERPGALADEAGEAVAVVCPACGGPVHGAGRRLRVAGRSDVLCCAMCEKDFRARLARYGA